MKNSQKEKTVYSKGWNLQKKTQFYLVENQELGIDELYKGRDFGSARNTSNTFGRL